MALLLESHLFKILYQDSSLVIIDKPEGFHVHQPENGLWLAPKSQLVLQQLRNQIKARVYPIHRLDVATSGVLVFALSSETAGLLSKQIQKQEFKKTYHCIVRGWTPETGTIDIPLKSDSTDDLLIASTQFQLLGRTELPYAVGKRHPTARYSLVRVHPLTGRYHQIRRHLARINHPLLGDCYHGDSHHNRFFREQLELGGLWLRSTQLEFAHPLTNTPIQINAGWNERWLEALKRLNWEQHL